MSNKYTHSVPFSREQLYHDYVLNQMSQHEIATQYGTTQKVVWRAMKNMQIPARVAAKRNQYGENNSSWKGKSALYSSFHQRVKYSRGRAKDYGCSVCGTSDHSKSYDWANLTGNYNDIMDYASMCRSCHRNYDMQRGGVAI